MNDVYPSIIQEQVKIGSIKSQHYAARGVLKICINMISSLKTYYQIQAFLRVGEYIGIEFYFEIVPTFT